MIADDVSRTERTATASQDGRSSRPDADNKAFSCAWRSRNGSACAITHCLCVACKDPCCLHCRQSMRKVWGATPSACRQQQHMHHRRMQDTGIARCYMVSTKSQNASTLKQLVDRCQHWARTLSRQLCISVDKSGRKSWESRQRGGDKLGVGVFGCAASISCAFCKAVQHEHKCCDSAAVRSNHHQCTAQASAGTAGAAARSRAAYIDCLHCVLHQLA
jgi:hypothetical protein